MQGRAEALRQLQELGKRKILFHAEDPLVLPSTPSQMMSAAPLHMCMDNGALQVGEDSAKDRTLWFIFRAWVSVCEIMAFRRHYTLTRALGSLDPGVLESLVPPLYPYEDDAPAECKAFAEFRRVFVRGVGGVPQSYERVVRKLDTQWVSSDGEERIHVHWIPEDRSAAGIRAAYEALRAAWPLVTRIVLIVEEAPRSDTLIYVNAVVDAAVRVRGQADITTTLGIARTKRKRVLRKPAAETSKGTKGSKSGKGTKKKTKAPEDIRDETKGTGTGKGTKTKQESKMVVKDKRKVSTDPTDETSSKKAKTSSAKTLSVKTTALALVKKPEGKANGTKVSLVGAPNGTKVAVLSVSDAPVDLLRDPSYKTKLPLLSKTETVTNKLEPEFKNGDRVPMLEVLAVQGQLSSHSQRGKLFPRDVEPVSDRAEVSQLVTTYCLRSTSQLPKVYVTDLAAVVYGAMPGDILRIPYLVNDRGLETWYRLVVHDRTRVHNLRSRGVRK